MWTVAAFPRIQISTTAWAGHIVSTRVNSSFLAHQRPRRAYSGPFYGAWQSVIVSQSARCVRGSGPVLCRSPCWNSERSLLVMCGGLFLVASLYRSAVHITRGLCLVSGFRMWMPLGLSFTGLPRRAFRPVTRPLRNFGWFNLNHGTPVYVVQSELVHAVFRPCTGSNWSSVITYLRYFTISHTGSI